MARIVRVDQLDESRGRWMIRTVVIFGVADAIPCRDDIRAVKFWRLAAGMLDESRCRLPP